MLTDSTWHVFPIGCHARLHFYCEAELYFNKTTHKKIKQNSFK